MLAIIANTLPHQRDHAKALQEGMRRHGLDAEIFPEGTIPGGPVVACWGWRIGKTLHDAGRQVLVMERGFIDRFCYASIGWDGINGSARRNWPIGSPMRLHVQHPRALRPWNPHGDYALIVGQVPGDAAVAGVDLARWYAQAVAAVAEFGPVRFRPHPVAIEYGYAHSMAGAEISQSSLSEDLRRARVVVTYNSNTGVDALLAGKPTIARGAGSMATIAAHEWEIQAEPERQEWANRLAWSQFSIEEYRSGFAWDVIKDDETAAKVRN